MNIKNFVNNPFDVLNKIFAMEFTRFADHNENHRYSKQHHQEIHKKVDFHGEFWKHPKDSDPKDLLPFVTFILISFCLYRFVHYLLRKFSSIIAKHSTFQSLSLFVAASISIVFALNKNLQNLTIPESYVILFQTINKNGLGIQMKREEFDSDFDFLLYGTLLMFLFITMLFYVLHFVLNNSNVGFSLFIVAILMFFYRHISLEPIEGYNSNVYYFDGKAIRLKFNTIFKTLFTITLAYQFSIKLIRAFFRIILILFVLTAIIFFLITLSVISSQK